MTITLRKLLGIANKAKTMANKELLKNLDFAAGMDAVKNTPVSSMIPLFTTFLGVFGVANTVLDIYAKVKPIINKAPKIIAIIKFNFAYLAEIAADILGFVQKTALSLLLTGLVSAKNFILDYPIEIGNLNKDTLNKLNAKLATSYVSMYNKISSAINKYVPRTRPPRTVATAAVVSSLTNGIKSNLSTAVDSSTLGNIMSNLSNVANYGIISSGINSGLFGDNSNTGGLPEILYGSEKTIDQEDITEENIIKSNGDLESYLYPDYLNDSNWKTGIINTDVMDELMDEIEKIINTNKNSLLSDISSSLNDGSLDFTPETDQVLTEEDKLILHNLKDAFLDSAIKAQIEQSKLSLNVILDLDESALRKIAVNFADTLKTNIDNNNNELLNKINAYVDGLSTLGTDEKNYIKSLIDDSQIVDPSTILANCVNNFFKTITDLLSSTDAELEDLLLDIVNVLLSSIKKKYLLNVKEKIKLIRLTNEASNSVFNNRDFAAFEDHLDDYISTYCNSATVTNESEFNILRVSLLEDLNDEINNYVLNEIVVGTIPDKKQTITNNILTMKYKLFQEMKLIIHTEEAEEIDYTKLPVKPSGEEFTIEEKSRIREIYTELLKSYKIKLERFCYDAVINDSIYKSITADVIYDEVTTIYINSQILKIKRNLISLLTSKANSIIYGPTAKNDLRDILLDAKDKFEYNMEYDNKLASYIKEQEIIYIDAVVENING